MEALDVIMEKLTANYSSYAISSNYALAKAMVNIKLILNS